ncbi:MAG: protein-disulfide isomerase, partial [Planctomycetota bacterium]
MTALDLYALCPCGNGKKIKFCKCRDSVSDLEQVTQMIQGGQIVPALDRLSKIIKSHPDAAWALSLRGQLLMETGEKEALTENSDRFLRLQPSNPIALTQRAAAALFQGEVDSAIDYLLEALAESGQETDRMLISFAGALADVLFNVERPLTARVYATLALLAGESDFARQQLSQMNQSRRISLLLKSVPPPLPRPADAAWGERFDEARGLLQSNKIKLAETKLASLNRSHPGEPAIVSGLLTCAIWIGNTQDQSKYLRMLSEAELLDMEQRARYLAMACFVNPQDYFSLNVSVLRGEV